MSSVPARFLVLYYHDVHPGETFDYGRVGSSATMYHVPERAFRQQIELVRASGLRLLDGDTLRRWLEAPRRFAGERGLALSFDDGWRGAVQLALPALAEHRIPAFLFITTGFVGRPLFVARQQLRELDSTLVTVGSHGVTHRMLSSLPSSEIRRELAESKRWLEDVLGRPATAVSVPGGAADRRVVEIAGEVGFTEIFTSTVGLNPTARAGRHIARLPVRRSTSVPTFRRWLAFRLGRERLRAGLLAAPKRLLGMRDYERLRRVLLGERTGYAHIFEP